MKLYKTTFSLLLCCSLALTLLLSSCVSEQLATDISAEQMEEIVQSESEAATSDAESPVPEIPGGISEPSEPALGNMTVDNTENEEELTGWRKHFYRHPGRKCRRRRAGRDDGTWVGDHPDERLCRL